MGIDLEAGLPAATGERRDPPDEDPLSMAGQHGGRIVIRRARASDLPALAALEEAAFAGDRVSRGSFSRFLRNERAILHVARAGGAVRGYALVLTRRGSRKARLYSVAVAREARGRGIGARLLEASERAACARGLVAMRLEVSTANKPAAALYEARGYEQYDRARSYYHDGTDALRLEKQLPAPRGRVGRRGRATKGTRRS